MVKAAFLKPRACLPPIAAGLGSRFSWRNWESASSRWHFFPMFGHRSEISQEHHQDQGIKRRFDKSVARVEALRLVVLGVDEENPESTQLATSRALSMKCFRRAGPSR